MSCDKLTDDEYLENFLNAWKTNPTGGEYKCNNTSTTTYLNLLDFINVMVHKGKPVSEWCESCITTVKQTSNGYLVIEDINGDDKPLYYHTLDVSNSGNISEYNELWPNVIIKTPSVNIKSEGIDNKTLKTVPIKEVFPDSEEEGYYLFITVPDCSNIPLPVYTKENTNIDNNEWPLVGNDLNPYNYTFSDTICEGTCNNWVWSTS
jgi:hypothetical protein